MIHYEDIRDVTSPLGQKNLNDILRRLWDKVANIDTKDITDGSITTIKLIDKVITSQKIAEATIETAHIKNANITEAKIEDASITTAKIKAANITNALIEDATITGAKIKDAEIGTAHIKNGSIDNLKIDRGSANKLVIADADISNASIGGAKIRDATIDTAQIALGAIKTALIDKEAVGTAQIADASITDAKIIELTANKITAGQLSVERLIIRATDDPTKSLVYQINNISGALQAIQGETLNGETLTERSITADKIVANAITANEIASKTITANEIATGSITAASGVIANIDASTIKTGKLTGIVVESDNYIPGTSGSKYDLVSGSIDTKSFKVDINGDVQMANATMEGVFEQYDTDGHLSVGIKNNAVSVYDWKNTGAMLGRLLALSYESTGKKTIGLISEIGFGVDIGYQDPDGKVYTSASFSKDLINFYKGLNMNSNNIKNASAIENLNGGLRLATGGSGSKTIAAIQYTDEFKTVKNQLTLLDTNGNTHVPNKLYTKGGWQVLDIANIMHNSIALTTSWKSFSFGNRTFIGQPSVVLTARTSDAGAITGKTRNVTTSGFEACIGGSGIPSALFDYIAFAWDI